MAKSMDRGQAPGCTEISDSGKCDYWEDQIHRCEKKNDHQGHVCRCSKIWTRMNPGPKGQD